MVDISIEFPAGVTQLLSRAAKISNWRDANLVRWDDGKTLRPVGGWESVMTTPAFASRIRAMHKWMAHDNVVYTAYLCEQHCYISTNGVLTDITPSGGMLALGGDVPGYGELLYSDGTYGTPRTGVSTITKFSPAWTLNNWGEDLLFMTSYDGRLLRWSPSSVVGTLAMAVPGAPINNRQFVVTSQRHCMLFGMGGNLADYGWCSAEDITDWNFSSIINTAGMYTADPYSPIVAAQLSDVGITVHTPAMTHFVDYIGLPYIYRHRAVGKIPIPISSSAVSTIPEGVVWASVEGFWLFNGTTANIIPCPLWDSIQTRMDFGRTVRESHMFSIINRGEIWWFWVDPALSFVANRYIALDFRSQVWMPGILTRTCGISFGNERNPLMSDGVKIWKHETGFSYPGAVSMPFLESQTLNVDGGAHWVTVNKILPDIAGDSSALGFRLAINNDRTDYGAETYTTTRAKNVHGYVDIRETGRDVRLRIDMIKEQDWSTVGPIIFDLQMRGKKGK